MPILELVCDAVEPGRELPYWIGVENATSREDGFVDVYLDGEPWDMGFEVDPRPSLSSRTAPTIAGEHTLRVVARGGAEATATFVVAAGAREPPREPTLRLEFEPGNATQGLVPKGEVATLAVWPLTIGTFVGVRVDVLLDGDVVARDVALNTSGPTRVKFAPPGARQGVLVEVVGGDAYGYAEMIVGDGALRRNCVREAFQGMPGGGAIEITLSPNPTRPGDEVTVTIEARGTPPEHESLTLFRNHYDGVLARDLRLDERGRATVTFRAPDAEGCLDVHARGFGYFGGRLSEVGGMERLVVNATGTECPTFGRAVDGAHYAGEPAGPPQPESWTRDASAAGALASAAAVAAAGAASAGRRRAR